MKYHVTIPAPSAKRLEGDRRVVIKCYGFEMGDNVVGEFVVPPGVTEVLVDGPKVWRHQDPNVLDGDFYHRMYVEYRNSTGSRMERREVEPVPVD